MEALPSIVCPVTKRVPFDVKEVVAVIAPLVILPPVKEEIDPVTALRIVLNVFEDVELVNVAFVAVRDVNNAVAALNTVVKKLVDVAFVTTKDDAVVVASEVCPVNVLSPANV